jgi:hypothetical protein
MKRVKDISEFFDTMKVDIKSDLTDWKAVKKELLTEKIPECGEGGRGSTHPNRNTAYNRKTSPRTAPF